MKRIAVIICVSVIIITLLTILTSYIITSRNNSEIKPETKTVPIPDSDIKVADTNPVPKNNFVTSSVITGYMIKSSSDSLYIYEIYDNGHYKIIDTLDVSLSTLPEPDSDKLKKGIVTESYEKMCHIIEDYSS